MQRSRQFAALDVELRASRLFLSAYMLVHAAAGAIVLGIPAPGVWSAGICAALALSMAWHLPRGVLLRHPDAVTRVQLGNGDECILGARNGLQVRGQVVSSSYVTAHLVVLHVRLSGRRLRRHVVVWPDSAPPHIRRRLRVRLRWTHRTGSDQAPVEASL